MPEQTILVGIESIRHHLGGVSESTVTSWRIAYDLPIYRDGGIWCVRLVDLERWWAWFRAEVEGTGTRPEGILSARKGAGRW